MTTALITCVIFGLMLAEQRVSRQHERMLRRAGAIEPPHDVFRAMAVLYPASFLAVAIEGWWHGAGARGEPSWMASGLLLFAAAKALKYWAIRSLGPRWTFRVLVLPGAPLVNTGPYRYVSHPNYLGVLAEIAGAAMMMRARWTGPVVLVAFGLLVWKRIRVEEEALAVTAAAGERS